METVERRFVCNVCDKKYSCMTLLEEHLRWHGKTLDSCSEDLIELQQLNSPVIGEKPFACSEGVTIPREADDVNKHHGIPVGEKTVRLCRL